MHRCYGCMELTDQPVCPRCGWSEGFNNAPHQLSVGTLLQEQYLVGRVLGQGGFGITYLGWDTVLDTPVAIKEFYPRDLVNREHSESTFVSVYSQELEPAFTTGRERILREAQALAKLRDVPQIVGVQNCFNANGTAYIIMEYVRGMDLVHYVRHRGGKLSMQDTLAILDPVMTALEKVHRQGLVHRDISPDNIMLDMEGKVRILDFGAVRTVEAPDKSRELSHSTEAIVKHGFAPMEQYRSRGSLGPWTDEYALCATIWYCVTGSPPPDALSLSMEEETLERENIPGLTDVQWAALKKGLSPRARDRFQDLGHLRLALQGKPIPTTPEKKNKPKKKKKKAWPIVAALLAVVLLAAGVFGYLYMNRQLPPQLSGFLDNLLPVSETVPTTQATQPTTEATAPPTTEAPTTEATLPTTEATEPPTEPSQPPTMEATAPPTEAPEPWEANVMAADPFAIMGLSREGITGVEFRSDTTTKVKRTYDVSLEGDGSVIGWVENGSVILAAEGGINGRESCAGLFADCIRLKTVKFGRNFHTEQTTDMSYMFRHCLWLESVDTRNLDTSSVTTMKGMFDMLHKADGSEIHTFEGNRYLLALDMSTWDVRNVKDMSYMFYHCDLLQVVNCYDWDTSSVTDMSYMFYWCTDLYSVDVSNWDMGNVKDTSWMFYQCYSLWNLNVGRWNVGKVRDMSHMFDGCSSLRSVNVTNWDTGSVKSMTYMFFQCSNLDGPNISGWDVSSLQDASYMFHQALRSGSFDLSRWDTSNLVDVRYMFDTYFQGLKISGISNWDRRGIAGDQAAYAQFTLWNVKIDGKDWVIWFQNP